ncbi:PhzF family phenazine biosynthesis protein [Geosporobacter ferrireducens]|uniref:Phenazine biosynthesis protein PhzF n=1 Tax=Geosporobacter ferrireducens TaxID=1424294 RepID=A0A1D8GQ80_9FIRM|nr:PhzF family phenazine biosynthesis protein [Geosporobacter ferrireducens]AOT73111.1 hypothetical protein Gferi_13325 [Geosporobacter ferrireducens]
MEKIIYQVDAFTDIPFGGNPAAVVPDAVGLTDRQMQQIAREMNVSETAFITKQEDGFADFQVRFFTPTQEVDLCGHATVGAFFVLAKKGYIEGDQKIKIVKQKTGAGILPVEIYFEADEVAHIYMTQTKPRFAFSIENIRELAEIMKLGEEDIGLRGMNAVPQVISTGLPDIILPIKNLDALKKIDPDWNVLAAYSNRLGVVGVHAFSLETEEKDSDLACRNFAPAAGINEEAATGTSNGALGAYLIQNNIIPWSGEHTLLCEQGYYMDRPSKILVKLEGSKEDLVVKVGGKAVITLEGVMMV